LPPMANARCVLCRSKACALADERDSLRREVELQRTAVEDAQQQVGWMSKALSV
jgi:hypothetical protein